MHGTDFSLGDNEINLLVHAMSSEQATSSTCVGCQQPGHTLTDCNRFVDYIVAQSLAQRHPKLRDQVAASHTQFRRRINNSTISGRGNSRSPAIRSLMSDPHAPTHSDSHTVNPSSTVPPVDDELDDSPDAYQLNALRGSFQGDADDFETCFADVHASSCPVASTLSPLFDSLDAATFPLSDSPSAIPSVDFDSFLLRRLAETYDATTRAVFAHADNGSMACTTSDATLLYSYRT